MSYLERKGKGHSCHDALHACGRQRLHVPSLSAVVVLSFIICTITRMFMLLVSFFFRLVVAMFMLLVSFFFRLVVV